MQRWKGKSLVDYAFNVNFMGATPIQAMDQIPELVQAGFPSFKVFICNVLPHLSRPGARTKWISDVSEHPQVDERRLALE